MKSIIAISLFAPYPENFKGISALLYYLIKGRPSYIKLKLYTFNFNGLSAETLQKVEKNLKIEIIEVKVGRFLNRLLRSPYARYFNKLLPYNIYSYIKIPQQVLDDIEQNNPDYIWLYPYYFFPLLKKYPFRKFVLTGCDSNALLNKRYLNKENSTFKRLLLKIDYYQGLRTEKLFNSSNCMVHFVGKSDLDFYKEHTGATNGFYSVHPHYIIKNKDIRFTNNKLRVLIAGANDFYMYPDAAILIDSLLNSSVKLQDKIQLTFLGKGWENANLRLLNSGFNSEIITWVDDYIDEIIKYDIQIIPIALGTGTKGKTLDAMGNGLLCIGSTYALENIDDEGEGALVYHTVEEVPSMLMDIYNHTAEYEKLASKGRNMILTNHDVSKASENFFKNFE